MHQKTVVVVAVTMASVATGAVMAATIDARPVWKPPAPTVTILIEPNVATTTTTQRTTTLPPTIATWPSTQTPPAVDRRARPPAITRPAPNVVYWANCTDAHEAGVTPIRKGTPGYRAGLDRDGDGVACETTGTQTPATTGSTGTTGDTTVSSTTTSTVATSPSTVATSATTTVPATSRTTSTSSTTPEPDQSTPTT